MRTFQNWEPTEAFTHSVLPVTIINAPWKSPMCSAVFSSITYQRVSFMCFEWAAAFVQNCSHFSGWSTLCDGTNKCKCRYSRTTTYGTHLKASWPSHTQGAGGIALPVLVHLGSCRWACPNNTLCAEPAWSHPAAHTQLGRWFPIFSTCLNTAPIPL